MFRLAEQIHRHPIRGVAMIRHDQNFRRPRDGINPHLAKHLPFSGGHKSIARPHNFINRRNRGRAIGERRHGLRPADPPHFTDPRNMSGGQNHVINNAIRGWHHHHPPRHACDGCGHGVHQHRGRIRRLPTRHIKPRRINRRMPHPQFHPRIIRISDILGQLLFMERANAACRG